MKLLFNFSSDNSGNTAIEYALIISFVALASIQGISLLHHSLVASLETMSEPNKRQNSNTSQALIRDPINITAGSLSGKLDDLRKKKSNQGLAIGHTIGNGINKPEGEEKFNKDEILKIIDEEKEKKKKGGFGK